jgi:hypothetical protein
VPSLPFPTASPTSSWLSSPLRRKDDRRVLQRFRSLLRNAENLDGIRVETLQYAETACDRDAPRCLRAPGDRLAELAPRVLGQAWVLCEGADRTRSYGRPLRSRMHATTGRSPSRNQLNTESTISPSFSRRLLRMLVRACRGPSRSDQYPILRRPENQENPFFDISLRVATPGVARAPRGNRGAARVARDGRAIASPPLRVLPKRPPRGGLAPGSMRRWELTRS